MEYMSKHFLTDGYDELILRRCDWTDEQWRAFLDIFGLRDAERIKVSEYKLEAFGEEEE